MCSLSQRKSDVSDFRWEREQTEYAACTEFHFNEARSSDTQSSRDPSCGPWVPALARKRALGRDTAE
jgi:hypothetical protein